MLCLLSIEFHYYWRYWPFDALKSNKQKNIIASCQLEHLIRIPAMHFNQLKQGKRITNSTQKTILLKCTYYLEST